MIKRTGSPALVVRMLAVALLFAASARAAETPAQAAPADLRDLAGKGIPGENDLVWRYAEIVVEWGFQEATEKLSFDGSIESTYHLGRLGVAQPLPGDQQTTMAGPLAWKSPA